MGRRSRRPTRVRPRPGAPVSTPLRWEELTADVRPPRLREAQRCCRGSRSTATSTSPSSGAASRSAGAPRAQMNAVVIGSGPNGSRCDRARASRVDVVVPRSKDTLGGGARSFELTPGLRPRRLLGDPPDGRALAVHPLARPRAGGAAGRRGRAPVRRRDGVDPQRDVGTRPSNWARTARRERALVGPLVEHWDAVEPVLLGPLRRRRAPRRGSPARSGASPNARPARARRSRALAEATFARARPAFFRRQRRALDAAARAAADRRLRPRADRARSRLRLGPRAAGRSGSPTRSPSTRADSASSSAPGPRGRAPARRRRARGRLAARAAAPRARPAAPTPPHARFERYRYGSAAFKLDSSMGQCLACGTVADARPPRRHARRLSASEWAAWSGATPSARSSSSRSTRFDDSRAPAGKHTAWRTATSRTPRASG